MSSTTSTIEAAYRVPRSRAPIDLRLDANEGPAAPQWVAQTLGALTVEELRRYPDSSALERAIARRWGVDAERVIATAGADEAIERVCRAVLIRGARAVIHSPTFEMIERSVRLARAMVVKVPWEGSAFPVLGFEEALRSGASLGVVVSPNNPTGEALDGEDLERVVQGAERAGVPLLVDLAYVEFADEDPTDRLLQSENVIVVRTFSKALGLAGLRIGYAIGPSAIIERMRSVGGPFPIAAPSLALAVRRLGDCDDVPANVARVREERRAIAGCLREAGFVVQESRANFVFARSSRAQWLGEALAGLGIGVRSLGGRAGLEDAVRITAPCDSAALDRLCRGIRTALDPQALIFDMDGVLADVSESYREAIRRTAESFGIAISAADIAGAKQQPGSNNDWAVTARLLNDRGIAASLSEVTDRFERVYQGNGEADGLWMAERLIPDAAVLRALRERLPLAIVTGRPRCDAERFLRRERIEDVFGAVICMEDACAKPDPAPVRRCLERLGVERAWFIGDAADDIVAARAAGVVPLGLVAPGDQRGVVMERLLEAGAARVIGGLSDILEILP